MIKDNQEYIRNLKISDIPWHRMTTAYGRATAFPDYFNILEKSKDEKAIQSALFELGMNIEHQGTLWHASPFAINFICKILINILPRCEKDSISVSIAEYLLDDVDRILQSIQDVKQMKHPNPLPMFSDMIKEEYLWSEEYDEEDDEMRYEDDEVFPNDLFYSFYYYSWLVVYTYQNDLLQKAPNNILDRVKKTMSNL